MDLSPVYSHLEVANKAFAERYPGICSSRLPIHTLYGGANLFKRTTPKKLGKLALEHFETYASNSYKFAQALELSSYISKFRTPKNVDAKNFAAGGQALSLDWLAETVYQRVLEKLSTEPIEDQRLDFEDGYGSRSNEEEDKHAISSAIELAYGVREGTLPPFIGIRIKSGV